MLKLTMIITYFNIGFVAGLLSGIFGIGGGSVRIPLLNLAGLPLIGAFGINLFVIPFSSTLGAITHRKNIEYKIGFFMIIGGAIGSIIGAFFVGFIDTLILAIIFVIVSVITVFGIYLNKLAPKTAEKINPTSRNIFSGALLLNFITGMRGGSGGSLFPPFLKAMKFDVHKAIATSLFITIFTAISATIIYWHRGNIIWLPALFVITGSMLGVRIGSLSSMKIKSFWLEIGLVILVIALAFITIYKAL